MAFCSLREGDFQSKLPKHLRKTRPMFSKWQEKLSIFTQKILSNDVSEFCAI